MKVEYYLVHEEGIKRGPYPSKESAIRSCPMATGYQYPEAQEHGWSIETEEVKESMNRAKQLINLVDESNKGAELDRESELKKKPVSELTDDELIYMIMFSDAMKASTEHPYMIEGARRGLVYEDKEGYAQLTKEGWEIWNRVKGSLGFSAGVSQ